jgi:hypothetical protein
LNSGYQPDLASVRAGYFGQRKKKKNQIQAVSRR